MITYFAVLAVLSSQDLAKHIYPLSPPIKCPPVTIDVSESPESKAWAEQAKKLVEDWFPTVSSWLATEDYKPPKQIKLVFAKVQSAPAWASGDTISVSAKWIKDHPDDLGMMIHELTHVIQNYPNSKLNPGWLVEGIADYTRWWRYEPEFFATNPKPRITPDKSKYTDSYRTTAYWLAWSSRKYHMSLVPALDRAIRKKEDPMLVFPKLTGKTADELWADFLESKP